MREKKKTAGIVFWILALLWVVLVFLLSRQSGTDSSGLSMAFTGFVLKLCPWLDLPAGALNPILREAAHGALFAVEGLLLGLAAMLGFGKPAGAALAGGICALLAVVSELVQTITAGRDCEFLDMGIDCGGALSGILAALMIMLFIDKLSRVRMTNGH